MTTAVYPGSFDPVTNGHLDLIRRASGFLEKLIVAIGTNIEKTPVFTADERVAMLREALSDLDNVDVMTFSGMTVDFCQSVGARAILRGIRGISDFESEIPMALTNRTFDKSIETFFMVSSPEHGFVSSRLIKETAALGGRVDHLIPPTVAAELTKRLQG